MFRSSECTTNYRVRRSMTKYGLLKQLEPCRFTVGTKTPVGGNVNSIFFSCGWYSFDTKISCGAGCLVAVAFDGY